MSKKTRPEPAWTVGAERLRIAQQYAGMPQHGLVFHVEQRTTGAGRAVLLTPQQVAEVHAWLGEWLAAIEALRRGCARLGMPKEFRGVPLQLVCSVIDLPNGAIRVVT